MTTDCQRYTCPPTSALSAIAPLSAHFLATYSFTQVFAQSFTRHLSDSRVSVKTHAFILPPISCIFVLALWGLARLLTIFSLLYGFFGDGHVVLWKKMDLKLCDDPTVAPVRFGIYRGLEGRRKRHYWADKFSADCAV